MVRRMQRAGGPAGDDRLVHADALRQRGAGEVGPAERQAELGGKGLDLRPACHARLPDAGRLARARVRSQAEMAAPRLGRHVAAPFLGLRPSERPDQRDGDKQEEGDEEHGGHPLAGWPDDRARRGAQAVAPRGAGRRIAMRRPVRVSAGRW
jgi:hypothetical protein